MLLTFEFDQGFPSLLKFDFKTIKRKVVLDRMVWTVSLKLRRIDWDLAGVGVACSAVRAPGQGADQVTGDAPAQGGDRPGAMAGRADRGAGLRGVGPGCRGGKRLRSRTRKP